MTRMTNGSSRLRNLAWCNAALVVMLSGSLVATAKADPVGMQYDLELTLFRPAVPFPVALERHTADDIPFDETEKIGVLTHIAPNPDVDNDLNVTEMAMPTAVGEAITIWVEGQKVLPGGRPVPLFTETVAQGGDGVRFILDNLYWANFDGTATVADLLFFEVTFPNPSVGILPTDIIITGNGTAASPLRIRADFDALDFNLNNTGGGGGIPQATDFHISFTVVHIPEPSTLVLAALALVGLFVHGRRRRRA